jgi:Protein of unknown function (DUF3429)
MTPRENLKDAAEPSLAAELRTPHFLTLIAILPQLVFLCAALIDDQASWTAPAVAFAYAASIFSFVGGYWWGVALTTRPGEQALFVIAVMPALLSFALFLPWIWGWSWPGSQLIALGITIMASILVDRRIIGTSIGSPAWLRVRIMASLGLGMSTMLIGAITVSGNG